jgi:predicted nucleic acid-binding protein
MKVSDALAGVSSVYFDSAPLVYYVEENPAYVNQMDAIIEQIERAGMEAFSSVILLPEVLMLPTRLGKTQLVQAYREILFNSRQFQVVAVSLQTAERATELRAAYNLRTPDAIHMATALETGCGAFLTNDLGLKRVTEIPILVLDELDI